MPASKPRWDIGNWTPGKVTILGAIGLPWKVTYPSLQAKLAASAANSAPASPSGSPSGSPNTGGGNVNAPASQSETDWWKSVLAALGAPASAANIRSLEAWRAKESPWNSSPPDGSLYTNNPLNTTLSGHNVVGTVNSVGVKRYATPKDGVAATVATMLGGYPGIVSRLRSGQGLCGFTSSEFSKWSGGGYDSVC